MIIAILWLLTLIGAFIGGMLVYRKNATKLKKLEDQALAKGKSLEEMLK